MADAISLFSRFCPLSAPDSRLRKGEFNRPLTIRIYGSARIGAVCAAQLSGGDVGIPARA
jgi:hypothetical protein